MSNSDDTQSEDGDGGNLLDFVYDAVMTAQWSYELEEDGRHADAIFEVVCICCDLAVFERSQAQGLSPAPGVWDLMSSYPSDPSPAAFTTQRHGGSKMEPTLDAVLPVMEVLYATSDVAHTDPSSVVVDCGICHAHFLASEQTGLMVSGWRRT